MTGAYGLLLSLGIGLGAALIWRLAPRVGVDRHAAMDLVFWSVLAGMVGARLLYVLVDWDYYRDLCFAPQLRHREGIACLSGTDCMPGQECEGGWCLMVGDCLAAFKVWQGGWVFLGGFLAAVPAALIHMRAARIAVVPGLALLAVAAPLGHAFGRVGCYLHGCCYGRISTVFALSGGRFPVQLVEAAGNVVIFGLLLCRFAKVRTIPLLYISLYALLRFVTELFRGDEQRGMLARIDWPAFSRLFGFAEREPVMLSTSQAISLALLVAAGIVWAVLALSPVRRPRSAPGGSCPAA